MLSDKAQQIISARYLWDTENTWADLSHRVGFGVGGQKYGEIYAEMINAMDFIPAGRILRNIGRPRGSLFNCYCLPIGDSREEIGDLFKNALCLWGEGGGIGINFSTLRPYGSPIKGVGGRSSGLVSFMQATDALASTVESGGQRRAAALGLCEVWHPEIERFIDAKQKDGDVSYFNISVGINEQFIDAVRRQEPWTLSFNNMGKSNIDSNYLWEKIINGMHRNGDPGLLNMSNLERNNSYYFSPVRGTNPCGEACLEDYGSCVLGSIVLPHFVTEGGRVKWSKLQETIKHAVRFLDTTIDINQFTIDNIKQASLRGRRIGLGVMGLADMLFSLRLRYGSRNAIDFVERLFKFIRNSCYEASIDLAVQNGTFPAFNADLFCKAQFVRSLPPSLRTQIRKYGIRNVTTMAMAPTGTISLVPEVTASIEPLMYKAYERKDRVSNRTYVHPLAMLDANTPRNDGWFVDSTDLTPRDHVEMQVAIQKYTDGAVSKTINLPNDYDVKDLSDLLLESADDLKGITVYRDGTRDGQVINPITDLNMLKLSDFDSNMDEAAVTCANGKCEL